MADSSIIALWESLNGRCNICISLRIFNSASHFFRVPNISDRFVSFASHFIRVQIFQIHLWGTKWMVVSHAQFYKNTEGESELKNRIFGHPAASKKRWDICKTNFSDFGSNFLLLGGVFHKCSKSKYHSIHQNKFFDTHFVCEKLPLHVFCFFPLFTCLDF